MKKSLILVIFSLIFNNSCSEHSTDGNNDSKYLIPFKVGNSWEYENIFYDTAGNVMSTSTKTEKIIKDTIMFNMHFYMMYINWGVYLTNKADGVWEYHISLDSVIINRALIYKYPCKTGDTYHISLGRPEPDVIIISTNEAVEVESETFNCILYRYQFDEPDDNHRNFYFAPGVGKIKYENYQRTPSGTLYKFREERLINYQLN